MKEFTYTIKEPVGIHARPAGMLAKEAKSCQSTVTIVDKNGKSVDATRLMALMGMGIKCGDTVTVRILTFSLSYMMKSWRTIYFRKLS